MNLRLEDDDLAFYAMHLLGEQEAAAVSRAVAESAETRGRLEEMRGRLGVYAETVEMQAVPEGSLERLMGRLEQEDRRKPGKVVAMPTRTVAEPPSRRGAGGVVSWAGWAVAAGLAVAAGQMYHEVRTRPVQTAQVGTSGGSAAGVGSVPGPVAPDAAAPDAVALGPVVGAPVEDAPAVSEAPTAGAADDSTKRVAVLASEAAKAKRENEALRAQVAANAAKVQEQASLTAEAQAEQDRLRRTLAAQADQVAGLSGDAGRARQVQEALTDASAVRVTLTKPKSKPVPTGRATYVANRGTLVFLASNLAPLQSNKVYELWLMPASGAAPVPAGTFTPDVNGSASVVTTRFAQAVAAKGFAITVENVGGASAPTSPILLAGTAGL